MDWQAVRIAALSAAIARAAKELCAGRSGVLRRVARVVGMWIRYTEMEFSATVSGIFSTIITTFLWIAENRADIWLIRGGIALATVSVIWYAAEAQRDLVALEVL